MLLGAREISLVGLDFSYPEGKAYSRGTYLYPLFRSWETRLRPLETQFLSFVFKNATIGREKVERSIRYTTRPLIGYKERLEHSLRGTAARVLQLPGPGVPLDLPGPHAGSEPAKGLGLAAPAAPVRGMFAPGPPQRDWQEFLFGYLRDLKGLPSPRTPASAYFFDLGEGQRALWATLLPAAAAFRERVPELRRDAARLLRDVLDWSVTAVSRALGR